MITFADNERVASWVLEHLVEHYDPSGTIGVFSKLVEERRRALHIIYHGGPLSWVLPQAMAIREFSRLGGGSRAPFGVFHRAFFWIPGLKLLPEAFVNAEPVEGFNHLVRILRDGPYTDIGIYPEGANAVYSDGRTVQEFKSARFIELSLLTGFQICLTVFTGADTHTRWVRLPKPLLRLLGRLPLYDSERLVALQHFVAPRFGRSRSARFQTAFYDPRLSLSDLSDQRSEREGQLWSEARSVRRVMQEMLDDLWAGSEGRVEHAEAVHSPL